jgi:hypothetical protein
MFDIRINIIKTMNTPKKYLIGIFLFGSFLIEVQAQSFISAVSEFQPSNDCIMELTDGTIVEGKVGMATINNGYLSSLTLKDASGEKHKHKAEEIKQFKVKMGFLAKLDAANEGSGSIGEMFKTDYNEIIEREYIIYKQALLPKKKDKFRLMQLVNPGFDSKIQVFDDPGGKETSGIISGGKDKSYLVVIDGKKSVEVTKGNYKKDFAELYGDCTTFMETIDSKKPNFWDMAAHVFAYDQLCK